jgi:signal transduction histidine kinase
MDIRLAGAMDGVEASEMIRHELGLPVIYLTAHSDGPTLQRAKVTEPFGYILKPFETRELEKTVARRTAKLQETVTELEHFSYAITHDMRAPLRAMQSFAGLVELECAGCECILSQTYFQRIKIASSRLDQGIGIPQDSHQRIFGMSQRAAKGYDGTSIGLAIVHKVVHRMGGEVGVESVEGQGSRFWVDLRRATQARSEPH